MGKDEYGRLTNSEINEMVMAYLGTAGRIAVPGYLVRDAERDVRRLLRDYVRMKQSLDVAMIGLMAMALRNGGEIWIPHDEIRATQAAETSISINDQLKDGRRQRCFKVEEIQEAAERPPKVDG